MWFSQIIGLLSYKGTSRATIKNFLAVARVPADRKSTISLYDGILFI